MNSQLEAKLLSLGTQKKRCLYQSHSHKWVSMNTVEQCALLGVNIEVAL